MSLSNCDNGYYIQVVPTRNVNTLSSFTSGAIQYLINNGKHWCPARSFLRTRVQLTGGGGGALSMKYGCAPSMFAGHNLYRQLNLKINGTKVNGIDDYVPQIAALKERRFKSDGKLNNLERTLNWADASLHKRIKDASTDGKDVDNEDEWSHPGNRASTVALTAANGAIVGVNTTFTADLVVGDNIYVSGRYCRVLTITDDLNIVVEAPVGGGDVGATAEWYRVRRRNSRRVNSFEIINKPPLSFFDVEDWMPMGTYELELFPHSNSNIPYHAVESTDGNMSSGAADDTSFKLEIVDQLMWVWVCNDNMSINPPSRISFLETACQSSTITTNSSHDKIFTITRPNTRGLSLAFQDASSGSSNQYSSAKFKIRNDEELNLTRYTIHFAGRQLPIPPPSQSIAGNTDYALQAYYENHINSYQIPYEINESLEDWRERGMFISYEKWPRNKDSDSQNVLVNTEFSAAFTQAPNMLLFEHYPVHVEFSMSMGRVSGVSVQ